MPKKRGRPPKRQAPQAEVPESTEAVAAPEIAGKLIEPDDPTLNENEDRVPDIPGVSYPWDSWDPAPGTPENAVPRRPSLLQVPITPLEDLQGSPQSDADEKSEVARQDEKMEFDGPPAPECVTAFAALARHVAYELPADSSAKENALLKMARSLSDLKLPEINFLLREVQLGMMEIAGLPRRAKNQAAPGTAPSNFTLPWRVGPDPNEDQSSELQHVKVGQLQEENFRHFAVSLTKAIESREAWQVAWKHLGLHELSEEDRDEFNSLLVMSMLAYSTESGRNEVLSWALADLIRSHKIKLRIFIEAVNDTVTDIGGSFESVPELMQVISLLLAALYPAFAPNTGYGWCRPGWRFKDWMRMVENLLGNVEDSWGLELLEGALKLLEKLPDGQVHPLAVLREVIDKAKLEFDPGALPDPPSRTTEKDPADSQSREVLEIDSESPGDPEK